MQKRKERESAIYKSKKLTENQKKKWLKVVTNDYMTSKESDEDNTDRVVVHPLPWRSDVVDRMFDKIRSHLSANKSLQAKRQMKERLVGVISLRSVLVGLMFLCGLITVLFLTSELF